MVLRKWILHIVLLISVQAFGQDMSLFEEGNLSFEKGAYAEALSSYTKLHEEGWESTALYYNMGNCHYELGQLGEAILFFEKAHALDPDDEDVLHNLKVANKKTIDRIEELPQAVFKRALHAMASVFKADAWAWIFLISLAFCSALFILYLRSRGLAKRRYFLSGIICLMLALYFMSMMYVQKGQEERKFGIVLSMNAYVKDGPTDNADDLFILHEGTKGEILDQYQGWIKVRLTDGKMGWLKAEQIGEI